MPGRSDLKKILLIGSGPIVIGQACEFDYSGTQACKALREEGYQVVLVNSNPATIMTDPETADRTYIEPITWDMVARVIERERPDALLPTLGGQTALNTAMDLHKHGVLKKYNVEMIGATPDVIDKAEDREQFKQAMMRIGIPVPRSGVACSLAEAMAIREMVGLPCVIRPSFTLGGTGGGIAYNIEEFNILVARGLDLSPVRQVLIEESVIGWKEFELEVMRDRADNVVIVCSIENLDPMGVHTGDSITVAPAQTLTDKEYQRMRDAAIAIIREIGVETGGSNIQFAVNPQTGDMIAIEMNPRVSRSSALASKATGFPIAKIAAKLAIGYRLDELRNDITRETPACFEPTIDYVVTKVPRWAFEKFPDADTTLTTQMKSVGETMAIGRTFKESLQKALRGLETGSFGLGCSRGDLWGTPNQPNEDEIISRLYTPTAERIWYIRYAFKAGLTLDYIHERTRIDPWFLAHIRDIVELEERLRARQDPRVRDKAESEASPSSGRASGAGQQRSEASPSSGRASGAGQQRSEASPSSGRASGAGQHGTRELLLEAKQAGFSDRQLAFLWQMTEAEVRRLRKQWGILPSYKCVDTCAAEFEAYTPYYYSTYEAPVEVVEPAEVRRASEGTLEVRRASEGTLEVRRASEGTLEVRRASEGTLEVRRASEGTLEVRRASEGEENPRSRVGLVSDNETRPASGKERIMILGGGPNRIGQGIEFDYCCCQAAFALRGAGYETIMVNSNPETVSTDYDTSDHLFFEPLTVEDVLNICDVMKPAGLIVQFGGQTPLNLARALEEAGAPIIGTSVESIDMAEDRRLFDSLVRRLGLQQPANGTAVDLQQAVYAARRIGYPVLVRPSYVLGGRAMEIVYDESSLSRYVVRAMEVSPGKPLLIDKFLESAIEVDVDCLADGSRCVIGGVMQHIEEAGIHSGDSACVIPPHSLPAAVIEEIKRQTRALAGELKVKGLMNVQFAVQRAVLLSPEHDAERASEARQETVRNAIYILEVNPRASRTVPFVSKATGVSLARLATLVMVGRTLDEQLGAMNEVTPRHFSVKESVFPFNKFPGVDIILGPEMRSTGEVMGIDDSFPLAFAKSQMGANSALPGADEGQVFISVAERDKAEVVPIARGLVELGYSLVATRGTARHLRAAGIPVVELPKLQEGRPNLLDKMKNDEVSLVINTPSGRGARTDEGRIRAAAVGNGVTCITTLAAAQAAVEACRAIRRRDWTVSALQDRFSTER